MLGEVERLGREQERWLTINWNPGRPLNETILEQRPELVRELQGVFRRGLRRLEDGLDLKAAPGGVDAEAHLNLSPTSPSTARSSYGMLEEIGRAAVARRRTIVVLVDEIQAASITDLKELTAALQQLANVQRLPVGLVAVGLPSTHHLLHRADVSPGFAGRLRPIEIGNLDHNATRDAIEIPFLDAEREVEPKAVELLAEHSNGYPYAIQLAGYHCWDQATGAATVTIEHAERAVAIVHETLETQIFNGRWDAISPADRHYLYIAAQLRDSTSTTSTSAIADLLGRAPATLTGNRDRLINQYHVLQPATHGRIAFAIPGFAEWIERLAERQPSPAQPSAPSPNINQRRTIDPTAPRALEPPTS